MNSQRREPYVNGRKSDRAAGPRQPLKIEQLGSSGRSAGFKPIPAELSCRPRPMFGRRMLRSD
jgi:hypothetical protein